MVIQHVIKEYVIVAVIFIVVVTLLFLPPVNTYIQNTLVPKPDRLTELYFENHTELPLTYIPGRSYPYSFTIHNLEYKTVDYDYEIQASTTEGTLVLSQNTVTLKHNEYKTISEAFNLAAGSGRTNIQVHLLHKSPLISFWVDDALTPKKQK